MALPLIFADENLRASIAGHAADTSYTMRTISSSTGRGTMCVLSLRAAYLKFQKGTTGRERVYKSRRDSALKAKLCSTFMPDETTGKVSSVDACENPNDRERGGNISPKFFGFRSESPCGLARERDESSSAGVGTDGGSEYAQALHRDAFAQVHIERYF